MQMHINNFDKIKEVRPHCSQKHSKIVKLFSFTLYFIFANRQLKLLMEIMLLRLQLLRMFSNRHKLPLQILPATIKILATVGLPLTNPIKIDMVSFTCIFAYAFCIYYVHKHLHKILGFIQKPTFEKTNLKRN